MCGIGGALSLSSNPIPDLARRVSAMNDLQRHRGPDGQGLWEHPNGKVGLGHRRLSIIDLETGDQPMTDGNGNWITYNGELYNYIELRDDLDPGAFVTTSDTEVILRAYRRWGPACLDSFRGMFSFALWDEAANTLFCARDRFGIKPFYYTVSDNVLYFASEIKALLPFVATIETDLDAFKEYMTFQFCLVGKTLFKGIQELQPGHMMRVSRGQVDVKKYWEVYFKPDFGHGDKYFQEQVRGLLTESVALHTRSDVPIGGYVSGGLDSSVVASLATDHLDEPFMGFTGKFSLGDTYDESRYARELAEQCGFELYEREITVTDFIENLSNVVYHLDHPVAGPGSFPQFMVSDLASQHRKVVLGGQGGDEIFGGYTRYLIAYFEQCIKSAIDGTMNDGNFIVTYESIIPSLPSLRNYKPMLQEFWRDGLFEDMDRRYFRLINRANTHDDLVNWDLLGNYSPFETFQTIFNGDNVDGASYFDLMTHFDFKTLLPALLHVEDRVSMAHGLESRVPFLDHPLVELAATITSDIKFKGGESKRVLKEATRSILPQSIFQRKDKMGFPVPLTEWIQSDARDFVHDVLSTDKAKNRGLIDNNKVLDRLDSEPKFGRKIWGFLCLELWQQQFHDKEHEFKQLIRS